MMAEILMGNKLGGGKGKEKIVTKSGVKEQRTNREQLPNCGNQETGETNGSVPLLGEIMKHL